jgi:hypothetical protein
MGDTVKTILCIGLNVGDTEPALQLNRTLHYLQEAGIVHAVQIGEGAWGDCGERMLQVSLTLNPYSTVTGAAAHLAKVLRQDCVSVLEGTRWYLVDKSGHQSAGGTIDEYPLLPDLDPTEAPEPVRAAHKGQS